MSDPTDPLPPLSPELEDFLRPERDSAGPSSQIADEIFSRLRATLDLPPPPLAPTDPTASPPPTAAAPHGGGDASGGAVPTGAGAGDLLRDHAQAALFSRASLRTVATLLIGAAAGAGIHEGLDRRAERRRAAVSAPAPATPRAPTPTTPQPEPPPVTTPARNAAPPRDNPVPTPHAKLDRAPQPDLSQQRDRDLAAERTLIEQARTALSREKGEAALAALERHGRDFPHGALEEERESLMVQVLVKLDRNEQARRSGARFHRRFPRSIFGAVVDDALGSIP